MMPGIMPSSRTARRPTLAVCTAVVLLCAWSVAGADNVTVAVEGVAGTMRDNVLSRLGLYQERNRELSPARLRRLHQQAPDEIRTALQPFGYYRAQVDGTLEHDGRVWIATYRVELGPAIPVTRRQVQLRGEGKDDPVFNELVENFPLTRGGTLDHGVYEEAKREFQSLALERGYFDLRFTEHEIRVDLENYRAEIDLEIDTGRRYRLGVITIDQDILDPALLARYIRIDPGDPYSTRTLLEIQSALTASEYFSEVDIQADPQQARDYAIPVHIKLTARREDKYTFGAGYGTDTGARGQIGWERRYINPQGHHTAVELRGSEIERSLSAGYFIPIRNPRTDQYAITAGYNEGDTSTATTEIRRLAVSRSVARGHVLETLSLVHQDETFELGGETGESTLLMPGVTWIYFWGDERIYVQRGARLLLDVRGASRDLGSDTSLLQGRFHTKLVLAVADVGRVIARGEIGSTRIDDMDELPASLRFFAGGDVSVRGYAYNTLGPEDADGEVVGGRHLLIGSLEYEQKLTGNWAAAVFYDMGNALNDFNDTLKRGAGVGLRWRSPVGQIRLDAASALSEDDHPWRIHLYIGPDL
jgi:translocation and assembly module TamA